MIKPLVDSSGVLRIVGDQPGSFLETGELVRGRVTKVDENGTAVISIKGRRLTVELPFQIRSGRELLLEVKSLDPRPILAVVDTVALLASTPSLARTAPFDFDVTSFMRKLIPLFVSTGGTAYPSMKILLSSLFALFYRGDGAESIRTLLQSRREGAGIKQYFRESMMRFVADVRGDASGGDAGALEEFEGLLKSFNLLSSSSGDSPIPIPFLFDNEMGTAWFRYGPGERGEERCGEGHFFSIVLDMSRLGAVEASVNMLGNGLTVLLRVENAEGLSPIRDSIPLFRDKLEGMGLSLRGMEVVLAGEKALHGGNPVAAEVDLVV